MNATHRESLSALVDGALEPGTLRFLLRRLDGDVELLAAWERYHLAGEALRGQCPAMASAGFAERVQMHLGARATGSARSRWLRWSAGGAIAASVAAVALMMAQPQLHPQASTGPTAASGASTAIDSASALASAGQSTLQQPSTPAQVPRWLMTNNSATRLAQPAAATFYGVGQGANILMPASYSQQMAPYMQIRGPRNGVARRQPGVRYVLAPPASQQSTRPAAPHTVQ